MAITKTNFINYTRCPRYCVLEKIRKDKLDSKMTVEEYMKQEENEKQKELLDQMFEMNEETDEEVDLTNITDEQLEAMMEYYKKVELLSGKAVEKTFGGKSIYSLNTYNQESFDFIKDGIRYLCYVDIYNETDKEINIIEVKATTSNKLLKMEYGKRKTKNNDEQKFKLFEKTKNNIYRFKPYIGIDEKLIKSFMTKIATLENRFSNEGKYIYDLAVQRYIIENDMKANKIKKPINYYLAVLNHEYIYDGESDYETDINGNEIISFFELSILTKDMMDLIESDDERLKSYLLEKNEYPTKFSKACALKSNTQCIYKDICYKDIPKENASYNYMNFQSFNDNGVKLNKYDLLNEGYYKLLDIPEEWIKNPNHFIQRKCFKENIEYINKNKIKKGLDQIKYPIYHLDFETFPCPIPRFKGEVPYTQSPFEFSLHIEREPGVCDKETDNYVFLAKTNKDERKELTKELVKRINTDKGCMLAQNVPFEKRVIKHLGEVYPEYKEQLMKIYDMGFDLLWVVRNNKEMYKYLGYDELEAKVVNFYNKDLNGSYSIKKTLPVFTDLSYKDLEIGNGTEALVEYSKFDKMDNKTLEKTRNNLIIYCKQDTWAMVEILRGLRKKVK